MLPLPLLHKSPPQETETGETKEKFTGKEFDTDGAEVYGLKGMNLNYFGARYYDPVIGYWISLDPAEQFWSGYSYSGNGFNPINSIDPDGRSAGDLVTLATESNLINVEIAKTVIRTKVHVKLWAGDKYSSVHAPEPNAYRHAYFTAALVKKFGVNKAVKILHNHEWGSSSQESDSKIDVENNLRTIKYLKSTVGTSLWARLKMSPKKVAQYMYDNKMLVQTPTDHNNFLSSSDAPATRKDNLSKMKKGKE